MHAQAKVTLAELKECLQAEYIGDKKPFSWLRLFHRVFFCQRSRYLFWWRVAQYFYFSPHRFLHKLGIRIGAINNRKYCNDISLKTRIGKGLSLPHPIGIVLTNYCQLGEYVTIMQGVTIGVKEKGGKANIQVGDHVYIGCNSSIIGGEINIGDNAIIGAHALVLKDVGEGCRYINKMNFEINKYC
ncbi:TPA: serine acetyltransferase [Proteus mirabilis]